MAQSVRTISCIALTVMLLLGPFTISKADQLADAARAFESGDYARAATLYKPLADSGNGVAQYRMGKLYSQGVVLLPDYPSALQWYMKAAEANNADAQRELGLLYSSGRGVRQNFKHAVRWLRLAAEQDDAGAQYFLGRMCAEGTGVPKDYILAEYWYRKSASQGNAAAQYELAQCHLNGRCGARDEKAALSWMELAVGNADDSSSREQYVLLRDKIAEEIASYAHPIAYSGENSSSDNAKQQGTDQIKDVLVLTKTQPELIDSTEEAQKTSPPGARADSAADETGTGDQTATDTNHAGLSAGAAGDESSAEDTKAHAGLPAIEAEHISNVELDAATENRASTEAAQRQKGIPGINAEHNSTSELETDSETVKDVL